MLQQSKDIFRESLRVRVATAPQLLVNNAATNEADAWTYIGSRVRVSHGRRLSSVEGSNIIVDAEHAIKVVAGQPAQVAKFKNSCPRVTGRLT